MQVTSVPRLQPGWLLWGFRIVLAVVVTLASSCGGGDMTGPTPSVPTPSVPTSLTISPQAVTLSWIGEPAQLSVEVRDQNGNVMAGQAVAWSSTNPAVATVAAGGLVIATGAGQAAVSASSGSASQAVPVSVTLVPHSMIKVAGDAQRGTVGSPLLDSLVAEVRDQGGTPIEGAAVSWSVSSGGGAITSSQDRTDVAGRTFARWTLGDTEENQEVTARSGPLDIVFTAEATPALQASMDPSSASIPVGESTEFSVAVAGGDPGAQASWTCVSSNGGVASTEVTPSGCQATGLATGNTTISAAVTRGADRVSAEATLEVTQPLGPVVVTRIEPSVLIEGAEATIHGTGFSPSASVNQVTVDGLPAVVTSATATRIAFTVPRADCLPPREAVLVVSNSVGSDSRSVGVTPLAEDQLEIGVREYRVSYAGHGCLHLPGNVNGGEYLLGVTSTSEVPSSLTPVSLSGTPGDRNVAATSPTRVPLAGIVTSGNAGFVQAVQSSGGTLLQRANPERDGASDVQEIVANRREAEARFRAREHALLSALGRPRAISSPAMSPARMAVGETITLWGGYPTVDGCEARDQVQAVVRFIGTRTVWLEDMANPSGTFADREFALLDTFYASVVEAVLERYFGELSDVDGNGTLLVLLTKEVNKVDGIAGYVWGGDLFPEDDCATSNQAEIFYGYVPDPDGVFGEALSKEALLRYYPSLLTHEITHLIQDAAYVFGPAGDKTSWEIEGGAALAEQLVAYDLFGHSSGQDLGYVQYNQSDESRRWYWNAWLAEMFEFFGWDSSGDRKGRVRDAPEECTWIGREEEGNTGPCKGSHVYGVPSMVLRFAMDRWGDDFPGGEAALMRRLTNSPSSGFSSLEEVSGWRIEQILAEFYMALWGDGRTLDFYGMSSWDLHDIFSRYRDYRQLQVRATSSSSPRASASVRGGSNLYVHWTPNGSLAPTSMKVTTPSGGAVPGNVSVWAWRIR